MDTPAWRLRGLSTVTFFAEDHEAAKQWYAKVFERDPYFQRPGYFEFRLGDYQHELGVIDARYAGRSRATGPSGAVVYWHVDDVRAAFDRLIELGAAEYEPPTVRGEGFVTAAVVDPFGNILGVMHNAHYLDVLAATREGSQDVSA